MRNCFWHSFYKIKSQEKKFEIQTSPISNQENSNSINEESERPDRNKNLKVENQ